MPRGLPQVDPASIYDLAWEPAVWPLTGCLEESSCFGRFCGSTCMTLRLGWLELSWSMITSGSSMVSVSWHLASGESHFPFWPCSDFCFELNWAVGSPCGACGTFQGGYKVGVTHGTLSMGLNFGCWTHVQPNSKNVRRGCLLFLPLIEVEFWQGCMLGLGCNPIGHLPWIFWGPQDHDLLKLDDQPHTYGALWLIWKSNCVLQLGCY